ncbi:MAG: DNA topoisomerase IV subunit A [bacterium]
MGLEKIMGQNFIEYASYVIKDRAIPEINDGLKPVQRRILHSLFTMEDGRFNKVANVVGHCMQYHPHGDASIYSALVNLANKEYFIEKQGNFGNIFTGDAPAAARYIECRLTPLAKEVLFNKDITKVIDSYDGRNKEPLFLPSKIPVLLLLGTEGIAVGMATKILPHNFVELLNGQIMLLKNKEIEIFPDFPQGGLMDVSEYNQGNGKIKIRALIEIKNPKSLIIREIPYGCTTESLINSIDNAAKRGKIKISQINDYTSEQVEIEVIPARGSDIEETRLALYAFTDCEVSISASLNLIKDNKPQQMNVNEVLDYYAHKLKEYCEAELRINLYRQYEKLFAGTLIQIFIGERVYKRIEDQKTYKDVKEVVFKGVNEFRHVLQRDITDDDIEMLLQIQIKRISRFDLDKNAKEIEETNKTIAKIQKDLSDITYYTIVYIQKLLKKYGSSYQRRTKITSFSNIDARKIALANIKVGYDTKKGYLGTEVASGEIFNVSDYDRIIYFRKDGVYIVTTIPQKKFIGENLLYVDKYDKNILFNCIYKEPSSGISFCKRFNIEKFILDKEYRLFEEGGVMQVFSSGDDFQVKVLYKPRPRLKVKSEVLDLGKQLVKGVTSRGNMISRKEIKELKLIKNTNTEVIENQ